MTRPTKQIPMPSSIPLTIALFTYNRSSLLRKSLIAFEQEIARCGSKDVEVVVSDNASPDDTETVARSFAERLPHFRYHRQASNLGPIRNYVSAIEIARGRYVWPFSDDDLPVAGMVSRVRELVMTDSARFYLGNFSRFSTSTGQVVLPRTLNLASDLDYPSIVDLALAIGLFETLTLVSAAIFDRERFLSIDHDTYFQQDTWFAHVYMLLDAFAGQATRLLAEPVALHNVDEARWRTQWREAKGRNHLYLHTLGTLRGIRTLRERGIVPPNFLAAVQERELVQWNPPIETVRPLAQVLLRYLASFVLVEMQDRRQLTADEWQLLHDEYGILGRPDLSLLLSQINAASERLRLFQQMFDADVAVLQRYSGL
jgi:glycosyltransferase involved in cell wall biosynthesis